MIIIKKVFFSALLVCLLFVFLKSADWAVDRFMHVKPRPDSSYSIRAIRLREMPSNWDDSYEPAKDTLDLSDGLEQKTFRMRTDADGYILPGNRHPSPDFTVVFVGGSTTQCTYVDEDKRFAFLAGEILEKRLNLKVNTFNSGLGGNNTLHSLDIVLNKVLPLKPDAVVWMESINDLATLLYEGSYWNNNSSRSPVLVIDKRPTVRNVVGEVIRRPFPHLHSLLGDLTNRPGDEFAHVRGKKLTVDAERLVGDYEKNVRLFIQMCRIWNVVPVLMTQQNRLAKNPDPFIEKTYAKMKEDFGIDYAPYQDVYARFNEKVRELGRKENVLTIDLDGRIPKDKRYIYDPCHFTNEGSVMAAGLIAGALEPVARQAASLRQQRPIRAN